MDLEEYEEVLDKCPTANSVKFIRFIQDNNVVVDENDEWILIENCKYHSEKEGGHYTAFLKSEVKYHNMNVYLVLPGEWSSLWRLYQRNCDGWEIKIKRYSDRSIKRFHVHFIE